MVAMLMSAPRTAADLADALELDDGTAHDWLKALAETGRINPVGTRRLSKRGKAAFLWRWNERRSDPVSHPVPTAPDEGVAGRAA
jgi:predicted ArsR family transcriptional regulator